MILNGRAFFRRASHYHYILSAVFYMSQSQLIYNEIFVNLREMSVFTVSVVISYVCFEVKWFDLCLVPSLTILALFRHFRFSTSSWITFDPISVLIHSRSFPTSDMVPEFWCLKLNWILSEVPIVVFNIYTQSTVICQNYNVAECSSCKNKHILLSFV